MLSSRVISRRVIGMVCSRQLHSRPRIEEFTDLMSAHDALSTAASGLNKEAVSLACTKYLRAAPIRDRILTEINAGRELNDQIVRVIYDEQVDRKIVDRLAADLKYTPWTLMEKIGAGALTCCIGGTIGAFGYVIS